jgi:uncharacterized protein YecE (DUF72 family)
MPSATYKIGRAGWALAKAHRTEFPADGTHLQRYAARFSAVEINSSFYRPHQPATYARWAASVPRDFSFSVKVPKAITHQARLVDTEALLDTFLAEAMCLGPKLGCLLVQLPPSLGHDATVSDAFFRALRVRYDGAVAFEPRHPTWFEDDVTERLTAHRVARVAADPAPVPAAADPAGWREVVYFRLHGSPRIYYSAYDDAYLDDLAGRMRRASERAEQVWCIFDNTALDEATPNALSLIERLSAPPGEQ